jgi:hypothetical protein
MCLKSMRLQSARTHHEGRVSVGVGVCLHVSLSLSLSLSVCVCVCVCVSLSLRSLCACVRARVCVCMRMHVCMRTRSKCLYVRPLLLPFSLLCPPLKRSHLHVPIVHHVHVFVRARSAAVLFLSPPLPLLFVCS